MRTEQSHTASPGDETSANMDSAIVDAAIEAFAGTGRPYIGVSGLWIYGDNTSISEESPLQSARHGGLEAADRTPDPRRPRHALRRDRFKRRLRRRRRSDPRRAPGLASQTRTAT